MAAARPLYLHSHVGTLEMGSEQCHALTDAFYYANHNDYSPLGEKPSNCASNTVPAISGAVASSKESSELGNADFGAIDWRAAGRRAGQFGDASALLKAQGEAPEELRAKALSVMRALLTSPHRRHP